MIFVTQILRRSEEEEDRGTTRVAFGYADENESMDSDFDMKRNKGLEQWGRKENVGFRAIGKERKMSGLFEKKIN